MESQSKILTEMLEGNILNQAMDYVSRMRAAGIYPYRSLGALSFTVELGSVLYDALIAETPSYGTGRGVVRVPHYGTAIPIRLVEVSREKDSFYFDIKDVHLKYFISINTKNSYFRASFLKTYN